MFSTRLSISIALSLIMIAGPLSGYHLYAGSPGPKEALSLQFKPEIPDAVSEPKSNPEPKPAGPAVKSVPDKTSNPPAVQEKITLNKTEALPARSIEGDDDRTAIVNRWFGLETGLEIMAAPADNKRMRGSGQVLSLEDCIAMAIKNHLPLQIAEKSIKLADMRVMEARRNLLPSVTIAFEPYSGKVNERNYVGRKQYIEGKQPLYHGGELYFTLKQAQTNLEITKNECARIKNDLVLQIKKAYYTLAKSMDNLRMQEELSSDVERIRNMVQEEYNSNIASKLELLNVSSQSSQVKYQLASAEGDVAVAELILKQAMNVDTDFKINIKPDLKFNRVEVGFDEALKYALFNRPEMRINTLMIEYYNFGKKIAASKSLPKIDLLGSWGYAKELYSPVDNAWGDQSMGAYPEMKLEEQWYAGIKAAIPFWGSTAEYSYTAEQWTPAISAYQGTEARTNSFKIKLLDNLGMFSEKQAADIDFDRARQELNKIRQDITLEVKEQCFSYEKALIQLDTAANKVKYQESDFEFMKMKRSLDEATDSNVIESMIKLSQEKFGYVQALTDCHTSLAAINKSIGSEDRFRE